MLIIGVKALSWHSGKRNIEFELCAIDAIRTVFVTKICTTSVLEQTRSDEIENDSNYNEKSSLIPDYLVLARYSATKRNNRKIAIGRSR